MKFDTLFEKGKDMASTGYESGKERSRVAIRKKAIEWAKKRVEERGILVEDLSDEEFEVIVFEEEKRIYDYIQKGSIVALAALGIPLI